VGDPTQNPTDLLARKLAGASKGGQISAQALLGVRGLDADLLDVRDAEGFHRLRVALLRAAVEGRASQGTVETIRKVILDAERSVVVHLEAQLERALQVIEQQRGGRW